MSFAHISWQGKNIQYIFIDQLDKGTCSPTAYNLKSKCGNSLGIKKLHASTTGGIVSIHGGGIKILQAMQHDQKINKLQSLFLKRSKWKGEVLIYCPVHFPFREKVVSVL